VVLGYTNHRKDDSKVVTNAIQFAVYGDITGDFFISPLKTVLSSGETCPFPGSLPRRGAKKKSVSKTPKWTFGQVVNRNEKSPLYFYGKKPAPFSGLACAFTD
jgi:hypothetical protein